MLRLSILPALFVALATATATAASAQTIVINPKDHSAPPPGVEQIHVQVGFNTFVAAPHDDSEQALKAQESARRMVYELASRECGILRDILASDCRLESINVNVQRIPANQNFGSKEDGFNVNGSISLRIVPKPAEH